MVRAMAMATMAFVAATAAGCTAEEDADRFREAIPQTGDVALRVPGASGGTTTKSASGIRLATNGSAGGVARYYAFTRDMTNTVDFGTAVTLGSIWALVNTPPTTIEAKKAVWGPGQANALEPAIWRFTVTEIADREYDYVLEGQPKSGGAWLAVVHGHGYGKSRPEHAQGWFEADNDAFELLEPTRARDTGKTKVTFDLGAIPATIRVELRPEAAKGFADVVVTHDAGGAGSVAIHALGDIDDEGKGAALENVDLLSRWTSIGSGRADVTLTNGDLPFTVVASECWSSSFARVYYKDTVDYEPASGDASGCAF